MSEYRREDWALSAGWIVDLESAARVLRAAGARGRYSMPHFGIAGSFCDRAYAWLARANLQWPLAPASAGTLPNPRVLLIHCLRALVNMAIFSLLAIVYFWAVDFIYIGEYSDKFGPLDTRDNFHVQPGMLCRLEFENVYRHLQENNERYRLFIASRSDADGEHKAVPGEKNGQKLLTAELRELRMLALYALDAGGKAPKESNDPRLLAPDSVKKEQKPILDQEITVNDLLALKPTKLGAFIRTIDALRGLILEPALSERFSGGGEKGDTEPDDLVRFIKDHVSQAGGSDDEIDAYLKKDTPLQSAWKAFKDDHDEAEKLLYFYSDGLHFIDPSEILHSSLPILHNFQIDALKRLATDPGGVHVFEVDPGENKNSARVDGDNHPNEQEALGFKNFDLVKKRPEDYSFNCSPWLWRSWINVNIWKPKQDWQKGDVYIPLTGSLVRNCSVTFIARFFGFLIALFFALCVVYYSVRSGLLFPAIRSESHGGSWSGARWPTFVVYLVHLTTLIAFLTVAGWLICSQAPLYFCVIAPLLLLAGECLRVFGNWLWPLREYWDRYAEEALDVTHERLAVYKRQGIGGALSVLFESHSHFFPLIGILGTFLGLGMAIPDRGLLDIISQINGTGTGISSAKWSELIAGIGVAVFASLHGTLTTIFAQIFAGFFGHPEEAEPENESHSGRHHSATHEDPASPVLPPETMQLASSLDEIKSNQMTLAADAAQIKAAMAEAAADLAKLRAEAAATDQRLAPIETAAKEFPRWRILVRASLHRAVTRLNAIMRREVDFVALEAELGKLFETLNQGPLRSLERLHQNLDDDTKGTRAMIDAAEKTLRDQAASIVVQAGAATDATERLTETMRRFEDQKFASRGTPSLRSLQTKLNEVVKTLKIIMEKLDGLN